MGIESLFTKWITVPVNTLYAITLDFYRYFPQRKGESNEITQNYAPYHMNYNPNNRNRFPKLLSANNNDEVKQLKENLKSIEEDIKRVQDTKKNHSKRKKKNLEKK